MNRDDELMNMRYGTLDSTDALNRDIYDDSDWKMGMLWFSALAATSRVSHVQRHGVIYTTGEVREFFSKEDNSKRCLCSLSPVLVNVKTREILQIPLVKRMLEAKNVHLQSK
jgi:hypothetical protein